MWTTLRARWNTDDDVAFVDFETQSPASLRDLGGRKYLEHPATRMLCLTVRYRGVTTTYAPRDRVPRGFEGAIDGLPQLPPTTTLVAHNAFGFDAYAWQRFVGTDHAWYDTQWPARAAGLPGGLDALAQRFAGRGKEEVNVKALTHAKVRNGRVIYPIGTPELWRKFLAYNVADAELLEQVYEGVKGHGEPDVMDMHLAVNQRGIPIDVEFARALHEAWCTMERDAADKAHTLTDGEIDVRNIRSVKQVKEWLDAQGFHADSLERKYLASLIAEGAPDQVLELLSLRRAATRSGRGKLVRALATVDEDGRIRDTTVYFGALTGRFSGRGFQPHNMLRSDRDVEPLIAAYERDHAVRGSDDDLAALFRPVIRSSRGLSIVDYAQVEARCVAWLARCDRMLGVFADPHQDIYCDMASKIYGRTISKADKRERFIGKQAVLGCGYGMGAAKFEAYCATFRVDLAAAGVSGKLCVDAYRRTYPEVQQLWRDYDRAMHNAMTRGGAWIAGRCAFARVGADLVLCLPSQRHIWYRNARVEMRVPSWGGDPRPTIVYDNPRGWDSVLYGGLAAENVSQGTCRDLMVAAMLRLGDVVFHVHDEVVAEGEDLIDMCRVMTEAPMWAAGFPIRVEGFKQERYSKLPFGAAERCEAMGGVVLTAS